MSKYIPVSFKDVDIGPVSDKTSLLREFINDWGMEHIHRKGMSGILYIELKYEILAISRILEYVPEAERSITLHNISERGLSLWFWLGQEGDEIIFIPFDNIACITGRNYENSYWAMVREYSKV